MAKRFALCLLLSAFFGPSIDNPIAAQEIRGSYSEMVLRDQPVAYWALSEPKSVKSVLSKAGNLRTAHGVCLLL